MLDVRQAEQLVFTAAGTIPDLERRIEKQENFISTLLGKQSGPSPVERKLTDQPHTPRFRQDFPPACWSGGPTFSAEAQLDRG